MTVIRPLVAEAIDGDSNLGAFDVGLATISKSVDAKTRLSWSPFAFTGPRGMGNATADIRLSSTPPILNRGHRTSVELLLLRIAG